MSVILANTIRYLVLSLFLLVFSQAWKNKLKLKKGTLALLAMSGVLGMTVGGVTFLFSVQLLGISRAVTLSSSSPVLTSVMSILVLNEKLRWNIIASSLMVVAGTYF